MYECESCSKTYTSEKRYLDHIEDCEDDRRSRRSSQSIQSNVSSRSISIALGERLSKENNKLKEDVRKYASSIRSKVSTHQKEMEDVRSKYRDQIAELNDERDDLFNQINTKNEEFFSEKERVRSEYSSKVGNEKKQTNLVIARLNKTIKELQGKIVGLETQAISSDEMYINQINNLNNNLTLSQESTNIERNEMRLKISKYENDIEMYISEINSLDNQVTLNKESINSERNEMRLKITAYENDVEMFKEKCIYDKEQVIQHSFIDKIGELDRQKKEFDLNIAEINNNNRVSIDNLEISKQMIQTSLDDESNKHKGDILQLGIDHEIVVRNSNILIERLKNDYNNSVEHNKNYLEGKMSELKKNAETDTLRLQTEFNKTILGNELANSNIVGSIQLEKNRYEHESSIKFTTTLNKQKEDYENLLKLKNTSMNTAMKDNEKIRIEYTREISSLHKLISEYETNVLNHEKQINDLKTYTKKLDVTIYDKNTEIDKLVLLASQAETKIHEASVTIKAEIRQDCQAELDSKNELIKAMMHTVNQKRQDFLDNINKCTEESEKKLRLVIQEKDEELKHLNTKLASILSIERIKDSFKEQVNEMTVIHGKQITELTSDKSCKEKYEKLLDQCKQECLQKIEDLTINNNERSLTKDKQITDLTDKVRNNDKLQLTIDDKNTEIEKLILIASQAETKLREASVTIKNDSRLDYQAEIKSKDTIITELMATLQQKRQEFLDALNKCSEESDKQLTTVIKEKDEELKKLEDIISVCRQTEEALIAKIKDVTITLDKEQINTYKEYERKLSIITNDKDEQLKTLTNQIAHVISMSQQKEKSFIEKVSELTIASSKSTEQAIQVKDVQLQNLHNELTSTTSTFKKKEDEFIAKINELTLASSQSTEHAIKEKDLQLKKLHNELTSTTSTFKKKEDAFIAKLNELTLASSKSTEHAIKEKDLQLKNLYNELSSTTSTFKKKEESFIAKLNELTLASSKSTEHAIKEKDLQLKKLHNELTSTTSTFKKKEDAFIAKLNELTINSSKSIEHAIKEKVYELEESDAKLLSLERNIKIDKNNSESNTTSLQHKIKSLTILNQDHIEQITNMKKDYGSLQNEINIIRNEFTNKLYDQVKNHQDVLVEMETTTAKRIQIKNDEIEKHAHLVNESYRNEKEHLTNEHKWQERKSEYENEIVKLLDQITKLTDTSRDKVLEQKIKQLRDEYLALVKKDKLEVVDLTKHNYDIQQKLVVAESVIEEKIAIINNLNIMKEDFLAKLNHQEKEIELRLNENTQKEKLHFDTIIQHKNDIISKNDARIKNLEEVMVSVVQKSIN
jgi:hypothetical protein